MSAVDAYLADLGRRLHVGRRKAAIVEEIRDHLDDSVRRLVDEGASLDDARARAVRAFGSTTELAREFNAAAGIRAMRRAPWVAMVAGICVVAGFLVAATPQPGSTSAATPAMQVTFFLAVVALQIAVVAGACVASRTVAQWRQSVVATQDRVFVRRATIISLAALAWGVVCLASNFALDAFAWRRADTAAFVVGGVVMVLAVVAGLAAAIALRVDAADDADVVGVAPRRALHPLLRAGESLIAVVRCHPVVAVTTVATAAAVWRMANAEAPSVVAALPWGLGEALAVVVAFVVLGPALDLRVTRHEGDAANA